MIYHLETQNHTKIKFSIMPPIINYISIFFYKLEHFKLNSRQHYFGHFHPSKQ